MIKCIGIRPKSIINLKKCVQWVGIYENEKNILNLNLMELYVIRK